MEAQSAVREQMQKPREEMMCVLVQGIRIWDISSMGFADRSDGDVQNKEGNLSKMIPKILA